MKRRECGRPGASGAWIWVGGLLALQSGCSRDPGEPLDRASRAVSQERIEQNGRWLADDQRAGRYYASPEADSTAAYLLRRLRALGIASSERSSDLLGPRPSSFSHSFSVTLYRLGSRTRLAAVRGEEERAAVPGRDFLPLVFSRNAEVAGPLVRLPADGAVPASRTLSGCIALVDARQRVALDESWLYRMSRRAEAAGAAAVLFAADARLLHGAATIYPSHLAPELQAAARSARGASANLQADRLSQAAQAQAWLAASGRSLPALAVRAGWIESLREGEMLQLEVALEPEVSLAQNVLVGFRGRSRPDELVILGTHFDHAGINSEGDVLNGADDNASGVAALLEIAAALYTVRDGLERSVLLGFFSAERQGLQGSELLRQDLPRLLGAEVQPVAMLALRGVGRNADQPLLLVGGQHHAALAALLQRHDRREEVLGAPLGIRSAAEESTVVGRLEIVPSRGSDHLSFGRAGVPSVLVTDGMDPLLWTQPEDDWGLVDAGKVARVARLLFRGTYELATMPASGAAIARTPAH